MMTEIQLQAKTYALQKLADARVRNYRDLPDSADMANWKEEYIDSIRCNGCQAPSLNLTVVLDEGYCKDCVGSMEAQSDSAYQALREVEGENALSNQF